MATEAPRSRRKSFESSATKELRRSSSINVVVRTLASDTDVSASQIVALLLKNNSAYAKGKAKELKLSVTSPSRPVDEWIQDVSSLYDRSELKELDGRLMILGLSILDENLANELAANDFLTTLQEEVYPSFDTLLTHDAKARWLSMLNNVTSSNQIDNVPSHLDHPSKIDELGRTVLAENLANRMRAVRAEEIKATDKGAFMVHINGPWGSGKSSLLNFLSNELMRKDTSHHKQQWVIVNFNAWENQRLGRPWWWLMNAIFRQGFQQLQEISRWRSITFWMRELLWRSSRTRWSPYLVALLALALLFWIIWFLALVGILPTVIQTTVVESGGSLLASLSETAKSMSAIIAFIITVWGIIFGLSRSLLQGSERAASTFMESNRDPMKVLTKHFNAMITHIQQPVAIFIDDLDRCQDSYVVELLEGIHTLFSEPLVTYVIAADQRWICASYEKAYNTFTNSIEEPGRPLRYLFLEKLFHLSTTVPPMSIDSQESYWQRLIQANQPVRQDETEKIRTEVKQALQRLNHEKDILAYVQSTINKGNALQERYAREEATRRLAATDVALHTDHALKGFAHLLEPNPRAMKRFVNTYGFERAVTLMVEKKIVAMEQLALWTIIVLRWPLLAEFLKNHPEMVGYIGKPLQSSALASEDLRNLFQDEKVSEVIAGGNTGVALDTEAIRACAHLRT
jgi:hypothetical protein